MSDIARIFTKTLDHWVKSPIMRPLLVRGARQVGKTWTIREWAKGHFGAENICELNLEKRKELHAVFKPDFDIERILTDLELICGFPLRKPGVLLFLDEIQAKQDWQTWVKHQVDFDTQRRIGKRTQGLESPGVCAQRHRRERPVADADIRIGRCRPSNW